MLAGVQLLQYLMPPRQLPARDHINGAINGAPDSGPQPLRE
jgi:hypothetical protein